MNRIGVIAALPAEARILSGGTVKVGGIVSTPHLQLSVCGIGAERARAAAHELLNGGVSALISWGCGAGLVESARPGTLFVPETVIEADSQQTFAVSKAWHVRITTALRNAGLAFETKALVSSRKLLTGRETKLTLQQQSGAGIADMESAAVARAAMEADCPFACIRAVADDLSICLPEALIPTLDEYGRPLTIALMRALLQQPSLIPQLVRLAQAFRAARTCLADVARVTDAFAR